MDEKEWHECIYPEDMLDFRKDLDSKRKLRLFNCACARRLWHLMTDSRSRKAVEVGEQYADGLASEAELEAALVSADKAWERADKCILESGANKLASLVAGHCVEQSAWMAANQIPNLNADIALAGEGLKTPTNDVEHLESHISLYERPENMSALNAERRALSDLFRCIMGNPFRPSTLDPSWATATVKTLAQSVYEDRNFADLPILADALEEAGCTNVAILDHCRKPGEHVRGCWVVDLVLGKK